MAVDVEIRQKSLLGKLPGVKEILLDGMGYGVMDGDFRLVEGETGDCTVVYDLLQIGRGFEVSFEKKTVCLRLPLPNSEADIRMFYRLTEHVCGLMGVDTFYRDGERIPCRQPELLEELIGCDMEASVGALKQMEENIDAGTYNNMYLFAAKNPISMGKRELAEIGGDLTRLGDFLNRLQQMDVYYAAPKAYQKKDGTIFGIYALTAGVPTVLPRKASLFMNDEIKVDEWYVYLVMAEDQVGTVDFDDFWKTAKVQEYYDAEHEVVQLTAEEMKDILKQWETEI